MIPQSLSHFQVLRQLGAGGMGEVYLAQDTSLKRKVALKFLPDRLRENPTAFKRLVREARAAAALDHPYICTIHEVDETGQPPFIVMEYVEGQTLAERISARPLGMPDALRIASEVAEALQVAHEKGIVHRDLKPANVMLTPTGHAKVMDFGVAKHVVSADDSTTLESSASLTAAGAVVGTVAYMAPEQLCGNEADARSDIFSYGVMLYETLAGVHPFRKETQVATAAAILSETPPPVTQGGRKAPEGLRRIVTRALAKDPAQRYQSMQDLRADLGTLIRRQAGGFGARLRPTPRTITAACAVLAVAAGAWFGLGRFWGTHTNTLAFKERDWILIADLDNATNDPVFDASLATAFTVSLQQSKYVNVFPRTRVQEALTRMRRGDVTKLDASVSRDVAIREGIKGILACSLSNVGSEYVLAASVVDPGTQNVVWSRTARAGGKDKVLAAVDDLAQQVRRELGESLGRIGDQRLPLPLATTSSLDALKLYAEAMRAPAKEKRTLLERALEFDPQFAMAESALGLNYYANGDRAHGEAHFTRAMSLLDRLTERERLWIRALVEDWRGNREQGIAGYKVYLSQYPDDPSAWFRLGYAYQMSRRGEECIEAYRRMLKLDRSDANAYINTASCYTYLQKYDEAVANYEKAFAIRPDGITGIYVNHEYGFLLVRIGQIQKAADVFAKMLTTTSADLKGRGHRSLGLLDMYLGKYKDAGERLKEAILQARVARAPLSEVRNRLLLAMALRTQGQDSAADRELASTRALEASTKIDPAFLSITGRLFARRGRLREATLVLQEVKSRVGDILARSVIGRSNQGDQANYHLLNGEVEMAQGRQGAAVEAFQLAERLGTTVAVESLAHAYALGGDTEKAIGKYQEFLDLRPLGTDWQDAWLLAHIEIGRLYERTGQSAEAAKYYQQLLDIWKDADQDLPPLVATRQRLSKVTAPAQGTPAR